MLHQSIGTESHIAFSHLSDLDRKFLWRFIACASYTYWIHSRSNRINTMNIDITVKAPMHFSKNVHTYQCLTIAWTFEFSIQEKRSAKGSTNEAPWGEAVGKEKLKFPLGRGNKHQTQNLNPRPKPFALNFYRCFIDVFEDIKQNRAILFIWQLFLSMRSRPIPCQAQAIGLFADRIPT